MPGQAEAASDVRMELANRVFFRLYQCANMMHKTGSNALESHGLTTQQWAVLGALSRPSVAGGMSVGDLARYLMVSRQNLSGVISRMERDGHLCSAADAHDRRVRLVTMTDAGRKVWNTQALPEIHAYYDSVLADFSVNDVAHTLHYLLKLLDNMKRLDDSRPEAGKPPEGKNPRKRKSPARAGLSVTDEPGPRAPVHLETIT